MKRIAIVTGASSGMGAEFVRQLGAEPCADEIWLLARRLDRLKEVEAAQNAAHKENPTLPLARSFAIDLAGRAGGSTVMDSLPEDVRRKLERMRRGEE